MRIQTCTEGRPCEDTGYQDPLQNLSPALEGRPIPSLLTDIKGKPAWPWVGACHLTHKQGKDLQQKAATVKASWLKPNIYWGNKSQSHLSCETSSRRPQKPPEAKLTLNGSYQDTGPGVAAVASSRKNVSDRRHLVGIEIERNLLALRVSPVPSVIVIQSGIPFLTFFPKPSDKNFINKITQNES